MPYRDSIEALRQRYDSLSAELARSREHTQRLGALRAREAQIAAELADTAAKLGDLEQRKSRLPLLEDVRIASPCNADWAKMSGDDRVRFCGECKKNVYNLSALPRVEAEALLAKRTDEMCVRLYTREDGTVLTEDCPVGVRKKRRRRMLFGAAGAGAMIAAAATVTAAGTMRQEEIRERPAMMGAVGTVEPRDVGTATPLPVEAPPATKPPAQGHPHVLMGKRRLDK